MTDAVDRVYPLTDPSGKSIPFDIGAPEGVFIIGVASAASAEKTLPTGWDIVVLYATVDTLVAFGTGVTLDLTQDAEKVDHQVVPAFSPVCIQLPALKLKTIRFGSTDGLLFVQKYRQWQALSTGVLQARIN